MNDTTPSSSSSSASNQSCRITQIVLLVSLLMMGAGNGLFMWNEIRQKNLEVTLGRKIVTDYQVNKEPKIKDFLSSLQTFARSNPDFNPILQKYNLLNVQIPAASAAPAAAPAPKKP